MRGRFRRRSDARRVRRRGKPTSTGKLRTSGRGRARMSSGASFWRRGSRPFSKAESPPLRGQRLQRLKQDLEAAQIFSGPQAAEALAPFKVLAVNGPEAGKEVDFITQFGDDPTFLIFIHHLDRLAEAFILPCERFAQDRAAGGLKTLYVYLAPNKVEGERKMRAALARDAAAPAGRRLGRRRRRTRLLRVEQGSGTDDLVCPEPQGGFELRPDSALDRRLGSNLDRVGRARRRSRPDARGTRDRSTDRVHDAQQIRPVRNRHEQHDPR